MERRCFQLPHASKKYPAKTRSTQNWPTKFDFCFPPSPELNVRKRHPAFSIERKPHRTGEPKNRDMSHSQMLGKFEYTLPAKF